jgi:hypothetical protein
MYRDSRASRSEPNRQRARAAVPGGGQAASAQSALARKVPATISRFAPACFAGAKLTPRAEDQPELKIYFIARVMIFASAARRPALRCCDGCSSFPSLPLRRQGAMETPVPVAAPKARGGDADGVNRSGRVSPSPPLPVSPVSLRPCRRRDEGKRRKQLAPARRRPGGARARGMTRAWESIFHRCEASARGVALASRSGPEPSGEPRGGFATEAAIPKAVSLPPGTAARVLAGKAGPR